MAVSRTKKVIREDFLFREEGMAKEGSEARGCQ